MTTAPAEPTPPAFASQASLRHTITAVLTALPLDPNGTPEEHAAHRHAAVAIVSALQPTDAIQHLFAAQTAAAHFATMDCFRRNADPDQTDDGSRRLLHLANGLARMVIRSLDRVKRHQGEAARRPAFMPGLAAAIARAGHDYARGNTAGAASAPAVRAPAVRAPVPPPSAAPVPPRPAETRPAAPHPAAPRPVPPAGPQAAAPSRPPHRPQAPGVPRQTERHDPMPSETVASETAPIPEPAPGLTADGLALDVLRVFAERQAAEDRTATPGPAVSAAAYPARSGAPDPTRIGL
jgi:hypothetical protein